jgi:hypothetical protein
MGEHRKPPPLPPELRRRARWRWRWFPPSLLTCGVLLLGIPFALVLAMGVALELRLIPDTAIVSEAEIDDRMRAAIAEHVELEPGERILFFYSAGLFSYAENGNVLTDRRAISWSRETGATELAELRWEELDSVTVEAEGSFFEDTLVFLGAEDESGIYLWLSVEDGIDLEALEYARSQL